MNEEGEMIISEEEFLEIQRLKDLKGAYRQDFEELKQLKKEVQYCQKSVDQCRQKLIHGKPSLHATVIRLSLLQTFQVNPRLHPTDVW